MKQIKISNRLGGVDPRQLQTLIAVAEESTFRDAAARLGYAQSAVSHQVAGLEKALATRLFDRGVGRREVRLTPAGEAACAHARHLLAGFDALAADFEARARGEAGVVRIGVFQTAAAFLLAEPLGRFHRLFPEVELRLVEGTNPELRRLLLSGDLDLAFDCDGEEDEDIELLPLVEDGWTVITPRQGQFAQRSYLDPRDLDGRPLIAWEAPDQLGLEKTFESLGVHPTVIFRTNDNVALTRFVAAGIGDACVGSLLAGSLLDQSILALPLRGRIRPRRISLASSRRHPPTIAALHLGKEILDAQGLVRH